jgi:hypothetical protein
MSSPDQAKVGSHVTERDTHVRGDLDLSLHQRGVGLSVAHVSALKDIISIRTLVLEETVMSLLH